MALITTKEMFKKAYEGGFAIGAFNISDLEQLQGVLKAAKAKNSYVMIQASMSAVKYAGPHTLVEMVKAASDEIGVDVALHLDHGPNMDAIKTCIDAGFSSVMIDGSHSSFEENIELTKSVVDVCNCANIPVEAQIGKVGGKEDDLDGGDGGYTDPEEAKQFVEKT